MKQKATLSLILTTILWGFGFVAVESALQDGWSPFPMLAMRGLIGGSFLFVLSYKKKWYKNKQTLLLGVVSGTLFFFGFAFQTFGQSLSSVSNAAFLTSLTVIFVPLISKSLFQKKLQKKVYIASAIALLGSAVLSFGDTLSFHFGDLLLIMGSLFFSFQIIYNERCGDHNDPLSITCIQLLTMGALSLISMNLFSQTAIPSKGWDSILYLAIFSSAIACCLQLFGQQYVAPARTGLILSLESILGTIFGIALMSQPYGPSTFIGGFLLFGAVLIVEVNLPKKTSIEP